jgi:hypothetical protein
MRLSALTGKIQGLACAIKEIADKQTAETGAEAPAAE